MKKQTLFGKDKETIKTILFWVLMFELTTKWVLGDISIPLMVVMVGGYITIIFKIVTDIILALQCDMMYQNYRKDYEYLEGVHKYRYKSYFSSDMEKISQCTEEIQHWSDIVLENGARLLANPNMTDRQKESISQMMDKTKELMRKEFVMY